MADLDDSRRPTRDGGAPAAAPSVAESPARAALRRAVINALGLPNNAFDDEGHLVLTLDGPTLHAQLIDTADAVILVLGADLGEVAAESARDTYAQLLAANLAWRSVGGGSVALDAESGHALLVLRFDGWPCTPDVLGQRLYAFIDAAERWAAVVRAPDFTPKSGDDAALRSAAESVEHARMATLFTPSNYA